MKCVVENEFEGKRVLENKGQKRAIFKACLANIF